MARSCSIVGGVGCHVPANVERGVIPNRAALLARCYVCGEDVCRDPGCSTLARLPHRGGGRRVRACVDCVVTAIFRPKA